MADTKISGLPAVVAENDADEIAVNQAGVTKKETRAQMVSTITASLAAHAAVTAAGVHGSSTAAAVNTLVHRDAAGRTQFVDPAAAQDASTKNYSDNQDAAHAALTAAGTHGSSVGVGASAIVHRDAAGRAQFTNPAAAQDASTKNYCDTTKSVIAHVHGAGGEATIVTGGITNNAVDDTKIRDSAATSVIGRAGAGVGNPADIVAGVNDRVFSQAGGTLAFRQVSTAMIAVNAASNTIIRDSAARSVIGRAAAAGGDPADIVAGADDRVLSRAAGTLAFRQVSTPMIANDAVDDTKAGNRVPQFYRRQGGHADDWDVAGAVNRTPAMVRMQGGVISLGDIAPGATAGVNVTFPVAFSFTPICFVTPRSDHISAAFLSTAIQNVAANLFRVEVLNDHAANTVTSVSAHWLAIGTE